MLRRLGETFFVVQDGLLLFMLVTMAAAAPRDSAQLLDPWKRWRRDNDECAARASTHSHAAFSQFVSRRGEGDYASLFPHEDLQNFVEFRPLDGLRLSLHTDSCEATSRLAHILPEEPLHKRALCPFYYRLDYNPLRIPAAITVAKCSCMEPPTPLVSPAGGFLCREMFYTLRVLLFHNDSCNGFEETEIQVPLACVPVAKAQLTSNTAITQQPASPVPPPN